MRIDGEDGLYGLGQARGSCRRSGRLAPQRGVPVQVRFTKQGHACTWSALLPGRAEIEGPVMVAGGDVPRDLAHFVLEAALGLERGFWGCVADGVVFPNMRHQQSAAARQVLRACAEALAVAEAQVNAIHFAWRRGERPIHAEQLDAMLLRWEALDDGASLLLEWPLATARDRRQPPR